MNGKINNSTVLHSALAGFQQRLTGALVSITIELPGYSGIGVTTRAIVNRNLLLWRKERTQFIRREKAAGRWVP